MESQTQPTGFKQYLPWIVAAIPALLTFASATAKLTGAQEVRDGLTADGVVQYITLLAITELLIVALYLYPKTLNLGFFLACSYFGGAMAVHISHGQPFTAPIVILTLYWIATFFRKPMLFLPKS